MSGPEDPNTVPLNLEPPIRSIRNRINSRRGGSGRGIGGGRFPNSTVDAGPRTPEEEALGGVGYLADNDVRSASGFQSAADTPRRAGPCGPNLRGSSIREERRSPEREGSSQQEQHQQQQQQQ